MQAVVSSSDHRVTISVFSWRMPVPGPLCFASIFSSTMSAVAALMCAVIRWPLGNPSLFVFFQAFILLLAIVSCVLLSIATIVEQRAGSRATVTAAALGALFLPSFALLLSHPNIIIYPALMVPIAGGLTQIAVFSRAQRAQSFLAGGLGALAGFGYVVVINARGYATVLSPEQVLAGLQHVDTLFHASISNMIVKHGAVSTGADGFTPISYHTLSHLWLGCLALWLGTSAFESYFIGAQIICIPLLFFCISTAVYLLRPRGHSLESGHLIVLGPIFLLFFLELWGWTSYLVSESYFLSIIIFLLALPLVAEMASVTERKRLVAPFVAALVAGILMALSKISVGFVFCVAVGFLLLRQLGLELITLVKLAVPVGLLAALVTAFTLKDFAGGQQGVYPFSFFQEYPAGAWPNLIFNILLVGSAILVRRLGPIDRKCAETFIVLALVGVIPAVLLRIPGGSAYYFINVGTFAGVVFLCAYGLPLTQIYAPALLKWYVILAAILLLGGMTTQKRESLAAFADELKDLQNRIRELNGVPPTEGLSYTSKVSALLAPGDPARRALARNIKNTPGWQFVQTLTKAGLQAATRAAVFVPPENQSFWNLDKDCRSASFFIPATMGVPMVMGINPWAPNCPKEQYGYMDYTSDSVSRQVTDAELCTHAAKWRLSTIFVLSSPSAVRRIDCGN